MPTATSKLTSVAEVAGILKQVDQAFTAYHVARNTFVTTLQGFLDRLDSQNVMLEALMKNDVLAVLCCPLAQDPVPGIQALALQNVSKLAACDPLLSQAVVSCGVLDSVVLSMSHENAPVQSGANMVLASVAGSSVDFARRVLEAGAMPGILTQLRTGTAAVKESAVRNLNSLIGSHRDHAGLIADEALLSLLVALLLAQDSPHSLSKAVVHTLATTAHYGPDMAAAVIKADALPPVSMLVRAAGTPPDLRAAAINCLAHIAAHNEDLAAQVAGPGLVESVVAHLADKMVPPVRRAASALLLQLARKTPALAARVVAGGCPTALTKFLQMEKEGEGCSTGVMLGGTLASYSPTTAKAVVDAAVGAEVVQALRRGDAGGGGGSSSAGSPASSGKAAGATLKGPGATLRGTATKPPGLAVGSTAPGAPISIPAAAAWALEQMSQHGEETTMPLIAQGALSAVLDGYKATAGAASAGPDSPDGAVFLRCKAALKSLIRHCNSTAPLEPQVADGTPPAVLKHVLRRAQPLLARDAKSRQQFVTSGGLMRLQELEGQLCAKGRAHLHEINSLFPADVVTYYRQGGSLGGGK
ncbi:hypothetical protein PLESTB_000864100 [Pleodorina starrii]|uniref:Uncharacterized protein n=1 Tax=Pleodorina starrii TaxID=330485 RepID=A0A9W6BMR4_9CHLO|nr:hypothetical protein PLESTM_001429900 [Pleodorina starrii]GLC54442.1 hypothetical protein PLESTB_000864100 [Pleodorina starrii]GLC72097.1 hypothetical protein PLESTF_001203500 [Pleodorina starrii]